MTLAEQLVSVCQQVMRDGRDDVELAGHRYRVGRTRAQGLRYVEFVYGDATVEGIEQNPARASRWAKLAQEGQRIMQFSCRRRYFANVCEGRVLRYPAWASLALPD